MSMYCPITDKTISRLDCFKCTTKDCEAFFCLVYFDSSFQDYVLLEKKLDAILSNQTDVIIVSGNQTHADDLLKYYTQDRGYKIKYFPLELSFGHEAEFVRIRKMNKYLAKQPKRGVVAFWNGKDAETRCCIDDAKKASNPLRIIHI